MSSATDLHACPVGGERPLTPGEVALIRSVFGGAIDTTKVRLRRRRWFPFQPARVLMAPMGHLHFHPRSDSYCDDFAQAPLDQQGLFIHEMVHIWQTQTRGRWYLPLLRHPFCRYSYALKPGWPLNHYGIEQQAEIVRHAFLMMHGRPVAGAPSLKAYQQILPFSPIKGG